ncbi:MAG: hypothetical protein RR635_09290, partial [Oscillospiraceae bacterium]
MAKQLHSKPPRAVALPHPWGLLHLDCISQSPRYIAILPYSPHSVGAVALLRPLVFCNVIVFCSLCLLVFFDL